MQVAAARIDALDVVAIELAARSCECSAASAGYLPAPRAKKQVTLSFKRVEVRLRRPLAVWWTAAQECVPECRADARHASAKSSGKMALC